MNTTTSPLDAPQDVAMLAERCILRLMDQLHRVLDACANLDNPRNVTATLRAATLLTRLCTSVLKRPVPGPRAAAPVQRVTRANPSAPAPASEPAAPVAESHIPAPQAPLREATPVVCATPDY